MIIQNMDSYINRLFRAIMLAMEQMKPGLKKSLEEEGVTSTQFYILLYLLKNGGSKVSDLAKWMEVKPSAVTTIIDRLVHHGFVSREHDEADRRIVRIRLTEGGKERLEGIKSKRLNILKEQLTHLSEAEIRMLTDLCEKIAGITPE
ncbi:DNA-binding MarR family transcriptional regulator [Laceyella sediminis]|jgi:DNA-binding MarR family transcriptional regulator|uniref:DNA-binding MarR family transcriptional regulator n=1 Tax=Laceyella sediminis TaxID=573074 RepID=A0ABX5EKV9_9BACL|nr:MarR family transcriptional regulator [Laceyella sediminis]PRZ12505.1 DNA-binding MarR family transcriptional regulator [Laceyella sediminis]